MFSFTSLLKILEKWAPIGISVISLGLTWKLDKKTSKRAEENDKRNAEIQRWKQEFEILKDNKRREEMLNAAALKEIETRASVMPYFNLDLAKGKIESDKNSLILQVSVENVGKGNATNVQLAMMAPKREINPYFESASKPHETYGIYDYLDKNSAKAGEDITFTIWANLLDTNMVHDFITFRMKYWDMIGNVYQQEFCFGFYEDGYGNYCFNRKYRSKEPMILRNNCSFKTEAFL